MKLQANIRPNPSVHFGGIYNNKALKKGLEFAANNGTLFAASTSLVLSTIARPLAILAAPDTEKENKQYACAKSLSSTLIGYLLMLGVSTPFAKAINKIGEKPSNYLTPETIKFLQEPNKNFTASKKYVFATQLFKLGLGLVLALPKSIMTSNLIPPIMQKLFPNKQNEYPMLKNEQKNISFGAKFAPEPLTKTFGKLIETSGIKKMTEKFHDSNFVMHIMSLTDILTTGAFMYQANNNKKIKEERKKPLIYNAAIATGLSITTSYTLDKLLDKPTEKFIKKFSEANRNSQKLDKYIEGIRVAKPVLILGSVYYILIPFVSTFLAEKIYCKQKEK